MARSDKDELIKSDALSLMHTYDLAPRDFGAHEAAPQGGDRRLHQRPNYKSAILLGIFHTEQGTDQLRPGCRPQINREEVYVEIDRYRRSDDRYIQRGICPIGAR
jgi:hypothetical protein